ncbi:MAG TPA: hypothetical protein VNE21_05620, partial [Mycobacteriales bacterium]|nr:hypothetical protein [Mycobacteriales bacterium]
REAGAAGAARSSGLPNAGRVRRFATASIAIVIAVGGCTAGQPLARTGAPLPSSLLLVPAVSAAGASAPGQPGAQRVRLRGVSVGVPAGWNGVATTCGTPTGNTVIVELSGSGEAGCGWRGPQPRVDVIWLGTYGPAQLGPPPRGSPGWAWGPANGEELGPFRPGSVAGVTDQRADGRAPDGRLLSVLRFPDRSAFVAVEAISAAVRDRVLASIQFSSHDPATGCPTHSAAFDVPAGLPRQAGDRLVVGQPVADVACRYVNDWLENTGTQSGPALARLVHALDAAPARSTAQSPDDLGCPRSTTLPSGFDDGVVAILFRYPDRSIRVVAATIVACNRLASYVTDGSLTLALTGAVLRAAPQLWTSFPDPDTMPG